MEKNIIAIGNAVGYNKDSNKIVLTSNSLQTSGIDFMLTMQEINGGIGNGTLGYLPHTTGFGITMEDALFDLNYMARNIGADITSGSDVTTIDSVTVAVDDELTLETTPVAPFADGEIIGWYKSSTDATADWSDPITFVGKTATATGVTVGETYCVKYFYTDASAREFTVSSEFVPDIIKLEVTYTLYATSQSSSTQTKVGSIQIIVEQFQFNGAQSYSISSSGASTSPIGGKALKVASGCSQGGEYARISEVITGKDPFASVSEIGVAGGDLEFDEAGDTETLVVYAFYTDGTSPSQIDNSYFTFVSGTPATATVGANTGIVEAVADGETVLDITVTTKPSLTTTTTATVAI